MRDKRRWLRPVSAALAAVVVGVLAWGLLGGVPIPGAPGVTPAREAPDGRPALVAAASATQPTSSGRWCDEGLGCSDAQ
jgi:hypothetical protein